MLPGTLSSDAFEMHFYLMRSMLEVNIALDVKSFCQNACTALMKNIVFLCYKADESFNRDQCKQLYNNMNETINLHESALTEQLKNKNSPTYYIPKKQINCAYILIAFYLAYQVIAQRNWLKNEIKECKECISNFSFGINLNNYNKMPIEYSIQFMNVRDKGGLM